MKLAQEGGVRDAGNSTRGIVGRIGLALLVIRGGRGRKETVVEVAELHDTGFGVERGSGGFAAFGLGRVIRQTRVGLRQFGHFRKR